MDRDYHFSEVTLMEFRINSFQTIIFDTWCKVNIVHFNKPDKYLETWPMVYSRDIRLKSFLKYIFRRHLFIELEYISIKDITKCTIISLYTFYTYLLLI